jgi:hypothetical protein
MFLQTPHANIFSEKGFADLEKIALINTRVTLTKIKMLKTSKNSMPM